MKFKIALLIFILLFIQSVFAEYRVFILEIRNPKKRQSRQIQSTMDPIQYASVYPLQLDEEIRYQDTWLCPGNTAHFKQHCERPAPPTK